MIRVVLADDHHLVRQGIRSLLAAAPDIEVIGEAGDGLEAVQLVEQLTPDVLVMDIAMPRMDGLQAMAKIAASGSTTCIVILSMHSDELMVRQALRHGALGYLLKRSVSDELLQAVRAASRRESYLSPVIRQTMAYEDKVGSDGDNLAERLSPREREVLQLVAEGRTNNEIAMLLQISIKTVEKHRSNLMGKMKVHDLAALIKLALKHGLIFLEN